MNYIYKYNKYYQKYLSRKKQIGGGPLEKMPQICFGTAQTNLDITLDLALKNGFIHIDGADAYRYIEITKDNIKKIPREQLWITWKSDTITLEHIRKIIEILDCNYIDLFLIHHAQSIKESALIEFKKAQTEGLIRFYGVSNCEDINTLRRLKTKYDISVNQIQARPPSTKIIGKPFTLSPTFIKDCNELGINIMLYGTMSGIMNSPNIFNFNLDLLPNVNKYYIQKYIKNTNNVLIVTSVSGRSIIPNMTEFNYIMNDKNILSEEEMNEIERNIQSIVLGFQG